MNDRREFHARIEALRGVAALLVAAAHASQARWGRGQLFSDAALDVSGPVWAMLARALRYALNGNGAVILFFVISGFVLSLSLDRGPTRLSTTGRRFFVARIFRLYPAVVFTIAVFALVYYAAGASLPNVGASAYSPWSLLRNALLLDHSINAVMWTTQLELLAMPLVFAAHRLRRRVGNAVVAALALALIPVIFSERLRGFSHPTTFAFIFGMLVPTTGRALVTSLSRQRAAVLTCLTLVVFFSARAVVRHLAADPQYAILPEGCAAAAFVSLLVYGPGLDAYRVLDLGLLRFYGRISYSFYLFHPLTLMIIWKMPDTVGSWIERGVPSALIAMMLGLVSIAVVTPLAAMSYSLVERRGVRLGRRFEGASPELRTALVETGHGSSPAGLAAAPST